jgi:hypothetical protein
MSSASKWFQGVMAKDFSYRQSQNQPLFHSGTNQNPLGIIPAGLDKKTQENLPAEPQAFVAGKSTAGGEDVAG